MVNVNPSTGVNTAPIVKDSDSSGLTSTLPPERILYWSAGDLRSVP